MNLITQPIKSQPLCGPDMGTGKETKKRDGGGVERCGGGTRNRERERERERDRERETERERQRERETKTETETERACLTE